MVLFGAVMFNTFSFGPVREARSVALSLEKQNNAQAALGTQTASVAALTSAVGTGK